MPIEAGFRSVHSSPECGKLSEKKVGQETGELYTEFDEQGAFSAIAVYGLFRLTCLYHNATSPPFRRKTGAIVASP